MNSWTLLQREPPGPAAYGSLNSGEFPVPEIPPFSALQRVDPFENPLSDQVGIMEALRVG